MLKAHIYATDTEARRAIRAIDEARHPDGTEWITVLPGARALRDPELRARCVEITLPDGTKRLGYRERRPAKTWSHPIELEDGRCAMPWKERLSAIEGREVTVDGRRVRIPREDEATQLEPVELENGKVVWRST